MRRFSVVLVLLLSACSQTSTPALRGSPTTPGFSPSQLMKSDLDRVIEAHQRDTFASLQLLAEKLYKRNPRELKKGSFNRMEDAVQRLFASRHNWHFPELEGKRGTDAVLLALKADYDGDRVFALMAGLGGMSFDAFEGRYESYLLDELDAQKLYNSARNMEIAVWKLSNARDGDGNLLLLTNEMSNLPNQPANLSFEREFGKLIGGYDTLSRIVADKRNRTVAKVAQTMATAVFLPVAAMR